MFNTRAVLQLWRRKAISRAGFSDAHLSTQTHTQRHLYMRTRELCYVVKGTFCVVKPGEMAKN